MGHLATNWHSVTLRAYFYVKSSSNSLSDWIYENLVDTLHQITHMLFDCTTPIGCLAVTLKRSLEKKITPKQLTPKKESPQNDHSKKNHFKKITSKKITPKKSLQKKITPKEITPRVDKRKKLRKETEIC